MRLSSHTKPEWNSRTFSRRGFQRKVGMFQRTKNDSPPKKKRKTHHPPLALNTKSDCSEWQIIVSGSAPLSSDLSRTIRGEKPDCFNITSQGKNTSKTIYLSEKFSHDLNLGHQIQKYQRVIRLGRFLECFTRLKAASLFMPMEKLSMSAQCMRPELMLKLMAGADVYYLLVSRNA